MTGKVIIGGVDMVKFVKPGSLQPYRVMAAKAIKGAIKEAGIDPLLMEQAIVYLRRTKHGAFSRQ